MRLEVCWWHWLGLGHRLLLLKWRLRRRVVHLLGGGAEAQNCLGGSRECAAYLGIVGPNDHAPHTCGSRLWMDRGEAEVGAGPGPVVTAQDLDRLASELGP